MIFMNNINIKVTLIILFFITGMAHGPFQMMDGVWLDVVYNIEMYYYNESDDPMINPLKNSRKK